MNSFAALDSDNEDEVVVQKPAKKEAAKAAPAATVAPVKAAPAASTKPVKAAGEKSAPKAPRGKLSINRANYERKDNGVPDRFL